MEILMEPPITITAPEFIEVADHNDKQLVDAVLHHAYDATLNYIIRRRCDIIMARLKRADYEFPSDNELHRYLGQSWTAPWLRLCAATVRLATGQAWEQAEFVVVETGVRYGFSSQAILTGLPESGILVSYDPEPVLEALSDDMALEDGEILTDKLLFVNVGPEWRIRLYRSQDDAWPPYGHAAFLDSDHDEVHMLWELRRAWDCVVPDGLILIDNIDQNDAFDRFLSTQSTSPAPFAKFVTDERWHHGLIRKPA